MKGPATISDTISNPTINSHSFRRLESDHNLQLQTVFSVPTRDVVDLPPSYQEVVDNHERPPSYNSTNHSWLKMFCALSAYPAIKARFNSLFLLIYLDRFIRLCLLTMKLTCHHVCDSLKAKTKYLLFRQWIHVQVFVWCLTLEKLRKDNVLSALCRSRAAVDNN